MPEDERAVYLKEAECVSAIPKIVTTGFKAVQLIYYFTAGVRGVPWRQCI